MNFAETLRNLRLAKNMTQDQLAAYLKVSRSTITGYETKGRQPDYEKILKLADLFQVTVDFLLTGNDTDRWDPLDREIQIACTALPPEKKQDALKFILYLGADQ